jgi:hypothetical protein
MRCDTVAFLDTDWTTQTFTAVDPGLNRIDILLAPRPSGEESAIQFRLWRDGVAGDLVAETEILAVPTDIPAAHTIYFKPVADSAGQPFVLGIASVEETAICAAGPDEELAFAAYGTQLISHGERDGVWIYENPNALPRAYLVHHAETVPADQLLERVVDEGYDFYHSVLLTNPLPNVQSEQLAALPIRPQGEVEITDYGLHRVDLQVATERPGLLVLADAHYPGWEVTVNGSKGEIHEVNGVFRGVFLPAGTSTVSFQFRPTTLHWGMGLAAFSIALALVIIIVAYVRRKSAPSISE